MASPPSTVLDSPASTLLDSASSGEEGAPQPQAAATALGAAEALAPAAEAKAAQAQTAVGVGAAAAEAQASHAKATTAELKPHQHLGVAREWPRLQTRLLLLSRLRSSLSKLVVCSVAFHRDDEDPYEYFKGAEVARLASAEAAAQAAATASARRVRPRCPSLMEIADMAGFHRGGHRLTELRLWPQVAVWPLHDSDIEGFGFRLQGKNVS